MILKFLKRLFETPSGEYGSLMDSRDPKVEFSKSTIDQVVAALKPIILPAHSLQLVSQSTTEFPQLTNNMNWPVNRREIPLHYYGTVKSENFQIAIFQNPDGIKKDDTNVQLVYTPKNQWSQLKELQPTDPLYISKSRYVKTPIKSLPIYEEIIHRYPDIHKLIIKLSPKHPWTLYKKAKVELCGAQITEQLGGYPQWIINDIDYRKINKSDLLIQIKEQSDHKIIFLFTDSKELTTMKQSI
ncbi:MAG: hypothetical protein ACSHWW_10680 [Nonlabens sp.]|uniref:hypothetical protein n=1 Tax=Nonlabens sp. TaxID=1888209 RepID=UPI003EF4F060